MPLNFKIAPPDAERRLDRWLQGALDDAPFSLVRKLLRQKKVRLNGKRARAEDRLKAGDEVVVHHNLEQRAAGPVAESRAFRGPQPRILLEQDDLLFLSKPAGVACSDDGSDDRALGLWIAEHLADRIASGAIRPEPCHRLDRGTTGVVVVALTVASFERFRVALSEGRVEKRYEIAVRGVPDFLSRGVDLPLRRRQDSLGHEPRMVVDSLANGAQPAHTELRVLRCERGNTLLEAIPHTGRTHQIRAHCHALGLPVLGDPRYGERIRDASIPALSSVRHPLLHARSLRLLDGESPLGAEADWSGPEATALRRLGLLG
jgi:23S rRNA pseudouridine955/2504/2580 synthase